jgi:tetratricopeptide (TPR) repeat protein
MSKILIILSLIVFSVSISGQQAIDYLLKAKAFRELGKPDEGIALLNVAIDVNKVNSKLYIERAEANLIKGEYSGAISDFNTANVISEYSGEFGLARTYALKGDAATAVYHLELNLNSPFRKSEKEIMLEPSFTYIDKKPEWRQLWKKDWYSINERNISEIEYYLSKGKIDEAKSLLSELTGNYKSNSEILYAEALVNFSSGKLTDANKDISGLVVNEPNNEKYLRLMAKILNKSGNPSGASETYTKLINMEVVDADLLKLRAECYRKTGETDKALADLERYLDLYPNNKEALSMAGNVEATSGDNLKALEYFSKNLKLHPEDPGCYIDRANSYLNSKTWDYAIKDYSMSLDLEPDNSDAWLNKGIALLKSGKTENACHDFRKSFSLGNKRASEYISINCIK